MTIPMPETPKQVQDDAKTDVQRELPLSNPFLPNSWIGALIVGFSNRIFDNYQAIRNAIDSAFYDTSKNDFLKRQCSWYDIYQLPETQAQGIVIFQGVDGVVIPSGTTLISSNEIEMQTTASATLSETLVTSPSSLYNIGNTAYFTFPSSHELASGIEVEFIPATPSTDPKFGTFKINVVDSDTVSYEFEGSSTTSFSGAQAKFVSASAPVTTTDYGLQANVSASSLVDVTPQIAGVNDQAIVGQDGLSGGADIETDEQMRARLLYRVANPVANFNVSAITTKCFEVPGVTRVFVKEITPNVGQVTIYFMRDNDTNPIPSPAEITQVKDKIIEIKPANTSSDDVIVSAPVASVRNFDFAIITPDTPSMRESVIETLKEFFIRYPEVGGSIPEDVYRNAIYNTIDTLTGEGLVSFELNSPSGDFTVLPNEIAILGSVVFP